MWWGGQPRGRGSKIVDPNTWAEGEGDNNTYLIYTSIFFLYKSEISFVIVCFILREITHLREKAQARLGSIKKFTDPNKVPSSERWEFIEKYFSSLVMPTPDE